MQLAARSTFLAHDGVNRLLGRRRENTRRGHYRRRYVDLIKDEFHVSKPAGEVMERMTSEAQAVLGRLGAALKVSRFGSAVTDPLA